MSLLVLSAKDVADITKSLPAKDAIALMLDVFTRFSDAPSSTSASDAPDIQAPHRTTIKTPSHSILFMPSRLAGAGGTAAKIVSDPRAGHGGLSASTVIMDEDSGKVKAIVNAGMLTALRTAAGCVCATMLLVSKRPEYIVCFGSGLQISWHIKLLLDADVYGGCVTNVTIINRSENERTTKLINDLTTQYPAITFYGVLLADESSKEIAVSRADLICCATPSKVPLFKADWVKLGTHINLVGSWRRDLVEVEPGLVHRAQTILVDSKAACKAEAGDLVQAGWGSDDDQGLEAKIQEVGTFVRRAGSGKTVDGDAISIFKSVGIGIQDVAIAGLVVKRADELQIGTRIPYD